jgi:hypothetical protein
MFPNISDSADEESDWKKRHNLPKAKENRQMRRCKAKHLD